MHEGNRIALKGSTSDREINPNSIAGLLDRLEQLVSRTDLLATRLDTLADKVGGSVPAAVKSSAGEANPDALLFRLQERIAQVDNNVALALEHFDRLSDKLVG